MSSNRPSGDRTLTWWPLAGAAMVAAVGVGAIVIFGSGSENRLGLRTDSSGALTCPKTYVQQRVTDTVNPGAWVPVKSVGVDGSKYLVPDTKAQHVSVCHYSATGTTLDKKADLPLSGRKVLESGLTDITKSLSKAPKARQSRGPCSEPGDPYLVGLVFPTGAVWISVPENNCQVVTNGEFDTSISVRDEVAAAYRSGAWT